jgi:hypothetical protein
LQQIELASKRIDFMREAFPDFNTMFWDAPSADQRHAALNMAPRVGLQLADVELREQPYDYERAIQQVPADHRKALVVMNSPTFFNDRTRLAKFALEHRMASTFAWREWGDAGGLISYWPSFSGIARRAVEYVDRIARGAKPRFVD